MAKKSKRKSKQRARRAEKRALALEQSKSTSERLLERISLERHLRHEQNRTYPRRKSWW